MQFRIKNTEIKISFSFFALILFNLVQNLNINLIFVLIFALIHELVHIIFISLLSLAPKKISFTLFGAEILRNAKTRYNKEIIINLSAPIFNLFLALIFKIASNIYKTNAILADFANINFVLGIFNLIPFYNFDGGNALNNLLLKFFNTTLIDKIMTFVSVVVTIIFAFFSILIFIKFRQNFSLFFITIYMLLSIIFKK